MSKTVELSDSDVTESEHFQTKCKSAVVISSESKQKKIWQEKISAHNK